MELSTHLIANTQPGEHRDTLAYAGGHGPNEDGHDVENPQFRCVGIVSRNGKHTLFSMRATPSTPVSEEWHNSNRLKDELIRRDISDPYVLIREVTVVGLLRGTDESQGPSQERDL